MDDAKTRKEIEKELGISRATFIRWVKKGKIERVTPTVPLYRIKEVAR